jgi:hypothetical protein
LQPLLAYRDLNEIVWMVSAQYFRHAYDDMTWCFAIQRMLACITTASPRIRIHNVLNATDVPEHVFITIVFHEMLHLEIRPVPIGSGRLDMHPPQFWEAERRRSPNYQQSWDWLYGNLPLRRRPRLQCTDVLPGVIRLTSGQRLWAHKQFGVKLPRAIRSDDPSSRRLSLELIRIAGLAKEQA